MTDQPVKESGVSRRSFMRLVGAGAGATGVALASTASQGAEPAASTPVDEKAAGYRESEHVKAYYAHARI